MITILLGVIFLWVAWDIRRQFDGVSVPMIYCLYIIISLAGVFEIVMGIKELI